tara:strand:- start:4186 stop:4518 length:333 start_codon:yes stop_codon:yes gene_type:complete
VDQENVEKRLIVGPDSASLQWVSVVAREAYAPFIVLSKIRSGDHDVSVSVLDVGQYSDYCPVLVDDIISTGMTMLETFDHLKKNQTVPSHLPGGPWNICRRCFCCAPPCR